MGYDDRRQNIVERKWNKLKTNEEVEELDYPFIEIPIEDDITTIVGANESGKSHLLSSIPKILLGDSIEDQKVLKKTDRCHYAKKSHNTDLWPNIGIQIVCNLDELNVIAEKLDIPQQENNKANEYNITIILGEYLNGNRGSIYIDNNKYDLKKDKVDTAKKLLPTVKFIHSDIPISSSISLASLIYAYKNESSSDYVRYNHDLTQEITQEISNINIPKDPNKYTEIISTINKLKERIDDKKNVITNSIDLELLLFRNIIEVRLETLQDIERLGEENRSYIESIIKEWNKKIEEELNLSKYWEQDDQFSLEINYKDGIIYFEIKDKTEHIYTFNERSSGLKYFLSYYIQAKSIGNDSDTPVVILMDEPDSFLSILGQKNLLTIFEDLTKSELSKKNRQIIYTTHSPFLINRNYPRRIRLVRKGDAEEGSQYIPNTQVRRYEPIRTALGIDCAQTIFMGKTNLILEGPADQFLICELIRQFIKPDNASEFIDLNTVIVTSASNGGPGVETLIKNSNWGDEITPAIIAFLDADSEGEERRKRLIGEARKISKMLDEKFVILITNILNNYENEHNIVTIEDIISVEIYRKAVIQYIKKWYPEIDLKKNSSLHESIHQESYGSNGLAADTKQIFIENIFNEKRDYDKLGVNQEIIEILNDIDDNSKDKLMKRMILICNTLRSKIDLAEAQVNQETGKQAIDRIIKDFKREYKISISVFDFLRILAKLERQVDNLGMDGDNFRKFIIKIKKELESIKNSGQRTINNSCFQEYKNKLEVLRKNPINPQV